MCCILIMCLWCWTERWSQAALRGFHPITIHQCLQETLLGSAACLHTVLIRAGISFGSTASDLLLLLNPLDVAQRKGLLTTVFRPTKQCCQLCLHLHASLHWALRCPSLLTVSKKRKYNNKRNNNHMVYLKWWYLGIRGCEKTGTFFERLKIFL